MVETFSNEYLTKIVANNRPVDAINGIGPKYKKKLNDIGIRTTNDLLKRALRAKDRRRLFSETDLSLKDLYDWAGMASLMMVNGIGPENAEILNSAGIENLGQLANQSSTAAVKKIEQLRERKPKAVKRKPSQKTLASWIDEARILFNELELQKSDVEDLTPATLRELDYKIHDILNFQNWKSFIQLGNSLQGLGTSKMKEFLRKSKFGEKNLGNSSFSKGECKFSVFIGTFGFYVNALGKVYTCPELEMDFLTKIIDHHARLEEIDGSIPEGGKVRISQKENAFSQIYNRLLGQFRKQIDEMNMEIDDVLNDIYRCLVAEQLDKLEETTTVSLWRLGKQLDKLLQIEHRMRALIYCPPNPPSESICLAVKINTILERLVTLFGICSYFLVINHKSRSGYSNLLKKEISIAKKTAFESQLPQRDFVPLSELLENSDKFKNSIIETCGILKMTKEWRKSDKIGFILQHNEKEVDIILKDCESKAILPPEESFVLLSGKLINTQKGLIIDVEKFHLDSLKKKSWLDHIMQLKSSFWYTGNHAITGDRFLRFPESARWIIKMYRRSK